MTAAKRGAGAAATRTWKGVIHQMDDDHSSKAGNRGDVWKHSVGAGKDGEDRFDAVVGLLGMLDVVLGNRRPGEPEDDTTRIEGWILGQHSTTRAWP